MAAIPTVAATGAEIKPVTLYDAAGAAAPVARHASGTLLASAARTATTQAPQQSTENARAIVIGLHVTANPGGAETLEVRVYGVDPVSGALGDEFAVLAAAAATNAVYRLMIGPGLSGAPAAPTRNKAYALPLPPVYAVAVVHSGAGSWTYSLSYAHMV
jgi:hypothetical protein